MLPAPGSAAALRAMQASDDNLGRVLRALDEKGVREKTNILIASDHGFSTIERPVDTAAFLRKSGFDVAREKEVALARGEVRFAGNGGSILYYVGERDRETVARLVTALQQTDFAGVIFSREAIEGTFPLTQVHMEIERGPDVVVTCRWHGGRNEAGVPWHDCGERRRRRLQGNTRHVESIRHAQHVHRGGPGFPARARQ
jgi:arylsulfatase A-like enzyme